MKILWSNNAGDITDRVCIQKMLVDVSVLEDFPKVECRLCGLSFNTKFSEIDFSFKLIEQDRPCDVHIGYKSAMIPEKT